MFRKLIQGPCRFVFFLWAFLFVASLIHFHNAGDKVAGDGQWYFLYCRNLGLYGDLKLHPEDLSRFQGDPHWASGTLQTPFSVGPALVWLPAFEIVRGFYGMAGIFTGYHPNGFESPFAEAIGFVTIAAVFAGLGLLMAMLLQEGVPAWLASGALALGYLGTFLANYTVFEPSMAHGLAFFFAALFLWKWRQMEVGPTAADWLLLGLILGAASLQRYTAVFLGWIPLAAWVASKQRQWSGLVLLAAGFLLAFAPQALVWHASFGRSILVPQGEGFMRWGHPAVLEVLWSHTHGLFASHPVVAAGLAGYAWAHRSEKAHLAGLAAFAACLTYVNASAGDWYGGWAFGARRFESMLPFVMLGLPCMLEGLAAALSPRRVIAALIFGLIAWNAVALQYFRHYQLRRSGALEPPAVFGYAFRQWGTPQGLPANLFLALRYGMTPGQAACILGNYVDIRERRQGCIDPLVDEEYLLDGWDGDVVRVGDRELRTVKGDYARIGFALWRRGDWDVRLLPVTVAAGGHIQGSIYLNGNLVFAGVIVDGRPVTLSLSQAQLDRSINVLELKANPRSPEFSFPQILFTPRSETGGLTSDAPSVGRQLARQARDDGFGSGSRLPL